MTKAVSKNIIIPSFYEFNKTRDEEVQNISMLSLQIAYILSYYPLPTLKAYQVSIHSFLISLNLFF